VLTLTTDDVVFGNPGQAPADRAGFSSNFTAGHHPGSSPAPRDLALPGADPQRDIRAASCRGFDYDPDEAT
jgi:hypothetical protein